MIKQYLLLLGLLFICAQAQAQAYKMHTLYMYSFSKYVQWPDGENQEDFVIGIVGESPIIEPLKKMASLKKVNNKLIKIVNFTNVDELQKCNILFLPTSQSDNLINALNFVKGSSTLLVTEMDGLGAQGSAINFIMKNNRLMFEINNDAIQKADLKVAPELKKYAVQL